MKIIDSSFDSVSNLYRDFKNNLTIGKFGWLFIYCLFVLYTEHFVDKIMSSEGLDSQVIQRIYYIQNFPILLFALFCLQDIYLKIITSDNIVFSKTIDKIQYIKLFRLFLFTVFIGYLALGLVSIFEYGIFIFFIVALFLEAYLLILPAFILIERPSNSYFLSIFVVVKVIGLQIFKIMAAMFIVEAIYQIICIPLYAIPEIYKLSIALVSKVPVVDNSVPFIVLSSVCYFIECYIGIILYAKLSILVYLSFKNRILYEMNKE